jgi:hypothetical protein
MLKKQNKTTNVLKNKAFSLASNLATGVYPLTGYAA